MSDPQPATVVFTLPAEFVAHCRDHNVEPGTVLRGFVADLCAITDAGAGFVCNGERATDLARWYFAHVGYLWWPL